MLNASAGVTYSFMCVAGLLRHSGIRGQPENTNLALNHSGLWRFIELFQGVSLGVMVSSCRRSTYDGGDVVTFQVTGDCNRLNQELILGLGVLGWLLLHSLQQNCITSSAWSHGL